MRPLKNLCEVAIIGGGLAGLSAARHAARLGHLVTLFEGSGLYGGQVATVDEVEGLPVAGHFSGQDLAIPLMEDGRKVGVRILEADIAKIETGKRLTLTTSDGTPHNPEAIIIASGVRARKLGVPGEEELVGRGVSRCATCDGGFFRGQDVAVIGGGDAAVHEALVLARTSRQVTMVCRSPLSAKREYIDRIAARENLTFVWDSVVDAVLDDTAGVSGIRVRNVKDGSGADIACAGVFPFIGGVPNSDFVPAALRDDTGHIKTDSNFATADLRLFAAGAVRAEYGGNAVQAMAEGVGAAEAVERLLAEKTA